MDEDITAKARRTWEEVFPACDVAALDDVVAEDLIAHGARPGEPPGIEGVTPNDALAGSGLLRAALGDPSRDRRWRHSSAFTRRTMLGTRAS